MPCTPEKRLNSFSQLADRLLNRQDFGPAWYTSGAVKYNAAPNSKVLPSWSHFASHQFRFLAGSRSSPTSASPWHFSPADLRFLTPDRIEVSNCPESPTPCPKSRGSQAAPHPIISPLRSAFSGSRTLLGPPRGRSDVPRPVEKTTPTRPISILTSPTENLVLPRQLAIPSQRGASALSNEALVQRWPELGAPFKKLKKPSRTVGPSACFTGPGPKIVVRGPTKRTAQ